MKIDPDTLYAAEDTSAILNAPQTTLSNWRYRGGGPRFIKTGRLVRYRGQDLLDYLEQNTYGNTAEARLAGGGAK